jgi:SAM-dependent methyltransferase
LAAAIPTLQNKPDNCNGVASRQQLRALQLQPGELLLDLGSGDGRICLTAAECFGCRAFGVELDGAMVERSMQSVSELPASCRSLVKFRQADILDFALDEAPTGVTMYLLPEYYHKVEPVLEKLVQEGALVVVFIWELKGPHWDRRKVKEGSGWWMYQESAQHKGESGQQESAQHKGESAQRLVAAPRASSQCGFWLTRFLLLLGAICFEG